MPIGRSARASLALARLALVGGGSSRRVRPKSSPTRITTSQQPSQPEDECRRDCSEPSLERLAYEDRAAFFDRELVDDLAHHLVA